jgi:hypothetical protein
MPARLPVASLFALCSLVGCSGGDALHPVEGKVYVSGVPAGNAYVSYYPRDNSQIRIPVARTEADGSYRLMTMTAGDGAPAGEYDVAILWPDFSIPRDECVDPLHDRLKLRYADPAKSELRAVVRPGRNHLDFHAQMQTDGGWSFPRRQDIEKQRPTRE